jgi:hypothetical protein
MERWRSKMLFEIEQVPELAAKARKLGILINKRSKRP